MWPEVGPGGVPRWGQPSGRRVAVGSAAFPAAPAQRPDPWDPRVPAGGPRPRSLRQRRRDASCGGRGLRRPRPPSRASPRTPGRAERGALPGPGARPYQRGQLAARPCEAATSCGQGWGGRAGNAPSRGPDAEAAPARVTGDGHLPGGAGGRGSAGPVWPLCKAPPHSIQLLQEKTAAGDAWVAQSAERPPLDFGSGDLRSRRLLERSPPTPSPRSHTGSQNKYIVKLCARSRERRLRGRRGAGRAASLPRCPEQLGGAQLESRLVSPLPRAWPPGGHPPPAGTGLDSPALRPCPHSSSPAGRGPGVPPRPPPARPAPGLPSPRPLGIRAPGIPCLTSRGRRLLSPPVPGPAQPLPCTHAPSSGRPPTASPSPVAACPAPARVQALGGPGGLGVPGCSSTWLEAPLGEVSVLSPRARHKCRKSPRGKSVTRSLYHYETVSQRMTIMASARWCPVRVPGSQTAGLRRARTRPSLWLFDTPLEPPYPQVLPPARRDLAVARLSRTPYLLQAPC
ncbi:translation initiation factor IF-2-like [Vulpes lagopus]|uniref:translation initiation factor IF-2-like n=1 Tax=Vulpes lagopus TaxID=494514 RepID=UPI001BC98D08|nr:translation initiation factor IF-2-like [Vulpes lagopus]